LHALMRAHRGARDGITRSMSICKRKNRQCLLIKGWRICKITITSTLLSLCHGKLSRIDTSPTQPPARPLLDQTATRLAESGPFRMQRCVRKRPSPVRLACCRGKHPVRVLPAQAPAVGGSSAGDGAAGSLSGRRSKCRIISSNSSCGRPSRVSLMQPVLAAQRSEAGPGRSRDNRAAGRRGGRRRARHSSCCGRRGATRSKALLPSLSKRLRSAASSSSPTDRPWIVIGQRAAMRRRDQATRARERVG
jgi:hypothetical protein